MTRQASRIKYANSEKGRATRTRYNQSANGKTRKFAHNLKYRQSEHGKLTIAINTLKRRMQRSQQLATARALHERLLNEFNNIVPQYSEDGLATLTHIQ